MTHYKKLMMALFLMVGIMSAHLVNINALEGSSSVPVSYVAEDVARFELKVTIQGEGVLYDGETMIKPAINNVYQLQYQEEKAFRIVPKTGYYVKSIFFDGVNITSQMLEDGTIVIYGLDHASELIVTFEKATGVEQLTKQPTVNTGDSLAIQSFVALLIISAIVVILLAYKKHQEKQEETN